MTGINNEIKNCILGQMDRKCSSDQKGQLEQAEVVSEISEKCSGGKQRVEVGDGGS